MINLKEINDRIELFKRLWNHAIETSFSIKDALKAREQAELLFLKTNNFEALGCDLLSDTVDPSKYDGKYGKGSFENIVKSMKPFDLAADQKDSKSNSVPVAGSEGETKAKKEGTDSVQPPADRGDSKSKSVPIPGAEGETKAKKDFVPQIKPLMFSQLPPEIKMLTFPTKPLGKWEDTDAKPILGLQVRNQIIIDFLNKIHDPLAIAKAQLKDPKDMHLATEFGWRLRDLRRTGPDVHGDPNVICYRRVSYTYVKNSLAEIRRNLGLDIDPMLLQFNDTAKLAGFTDELIKEFSENLVRGDRHDDKFAHCIAILNQEFLDKLYKVAVCYKPEEIVRSAAKP